MTAFTWISATALVLGLILLLGRGARWLGARGPADAPARQRDQWRVAPDARVRAVEVLGKVHLLYERGRVAVVLETLSREDYENRAAERAASAPVVSLARLRHRGGRS